MAIFGNKNKKEGKGAAAKPAKDAAKKTAPKKGATKDSVKRSASGVLLRPHITEKAAQATARNVYTFDISKGATKADVARAVRDVYRVKPTKVNITKTPGKKVRLRTRRGYGQRSGSTKAYVYLKEGDRIEFSS